MSVCLFDSVVCLKLSMHIRTVVKVRYEAQTSYVSYRLGKGLGGVVFPWFPQCGCRVLFNKHIFMDTGNIYTA